MLRAPLALALAWILLISGALGGCTGPGLEPPHAALAAPKSPAKDTGANAGAAAKPPTRPMTPGAMSPPVPAESAGDDDQCTPECGQRSCGSDGCGGSCGACAGGSVCGADGQCECDDDAGCGDECDACAAPADAGV